MCFLHIQMHKRTTVTTYTFLHLYTHIEQNIYLLNGSGYRTCLSHTQTHTRPELVFTSDTHSPPEMTPTGTGRHTITHVLGSTTQMVSRRCRAVSGRPGSQRPWSTPSPNRATLTPVSVCPPFRKPHPVLPSLSPSPLGLWQPVFQAEPATNSPS